VEIVKLPLFSRLVRYDVFSARVCGKLNVSNSWSSRTIRLYALAYDEKITETDNMSLHLYTEDL
jgi:hypothetical protein